MTTTETELATWPDRFHLPHEDDERAAWRIRSLDEAVWATRLVRQADNRIDQVVAAGEAEIARIKEWMTAATVTPKRDRAFLEGALTGYALRERQADPRRKTITTPWGKVATTERGPSLIITDAEVFITAIRAAQLPDLVHVTVTERPDLVAAKATLQLDLDTGLVLHPTTGEPIDGAAINPAGLTARVTLTKE